MPAPDRANDPRRRPQFRTEVDKTSQQMANQNTDIITKSDYQQKHGWVSAWPTGHPNHSSVVSKDEQTENVRRQRGY